MNHFDKITVSTKNIHLFYLYLLNNEDMNKIHEDLKSISYLRAIHKIGNKICVLFKNGVSFDDAYDILKSYDSLSIPKVPQGSPHSSLHVSDMV